MRAWEWGPGGEAESRAQMIGRQPGWVIVTDDCRRECEELEARGVTAVPGGCDDKRHRIKDQRSDSLQGEAPIRLEVFK